MTLSPTLACVRVSVATITAFLPMGLNPLRHPRVRGRPLEAPR
jgi:hypothetical protein